jgi:hypothetical protein
MSEQDERLILDFLSAFPQVFVSATEISRKADGRHRFTEDPHWAHHALQNLLARRLIEMNNSGHYRLAHKW